jgi:hypothetical protein
VIKKRKVGMNDQKEAMFDLPIKSWDVYEIFNQIWEHIEVGEKYHPRDIVHMIEHWTMYQRSPYDGTITRYLRKRRKLFGDVELVSSSKSLYRKK